jgi:citrate lyase beta subunit
MLKKAQGLPADQVFLDLEDAVAPIAKPAARATVVEALSRGDWSGKTRVVRGNDADTEWAHEDVLQVVRGAGADLDCIMLPKVERVACAGAKKCVPTTRSGPSTAAASSSRRVVAWLERAPGFGW